MVGGLGARVLTRCDWHTWQAYGPDVQRAWKAHRTARGDNSLVHQRVDEAKCAVRCTRAARPTGRSALPISYVAPCVRTREGSRRMGRD